jgi:hypothetical protein
MFFDPIDPFDSGRLSTRVGNPPPFEPIKFGKFAELQVCAKVNPDAEFSTPLKQRSSISVCPWT